MGTIRGKDMKKDKQISIRLDEATFWAFKKICSNERLTTQKFLELVICEIVKGASNEGD